MTTEELRNIPIAELLLHLGYKPVGRSRGGTQLLFRSPLRDDRNASFSVSTKLNLWQDFGTGKGGNVIDLAIALNGNCSFRDAAKWLEQQFGTLSETSERNQIKDVVYTQEKESILEDLEVRALDHRALLDYIGSRGIPAEIGRRYCREIHYSIHGRSYFALCFGNLLGGMEIRNAFFKGCYGPKSPSIIYVSKHQRSFSCCVFEGFMDFLSYVVLKERGDKTLVRQDPCDCIVLNSTGMVPRAIPFIEVYGHAYCYLDNDQAGRMAFDKLRDSLGDKVESMSPLFGDHGDLNDFLTGKRAVVRLDSG